METAIYKAHTLEKLSSEINKITNKHLEITNKIRILEESLLRLETYCLKFLKPQPPVVVLRESKERLHLIRQIKSIQGQIFLLRSDLDTLDEDFSLLFDYCDKLSKDQELPVFPYKYASLLFENF
jgi:hypothetical protein